MLVKGKVAVLVLLTFLTNYSDGYNILVIFGHPGKSHYEVFSGLFDELAARGHNLTILSHVKGRNTPNIRVSLLIKDFTFKFNEINFLVCKSA